MVVYNEKSKKTLQTIKTNKEFSKSTEYEICVCAYMYTHTHIYQQC